jgi:hypothetical protein
MRVRIKYHKGHYFPQRRVLGVWWNYTQALPGPVYNWTVKFTTERDAFTFLYAQRCIRHKKDRSRSEPIIVKEFEL